jgi:chemotaxis methyl-accepting protein methylase
VEGRKLDPAPEFPVVGVGASAGGIEALKALFSRIPARPNLAMVVLQHRSAEQPDRLASLLAQWTVMPVCEATAGRVIERDRIYVAPPARVLSVERGAFQSEAMEARGRAGSQSIDAFFESLAVDLGPRAIAVVLSGTGADGAAGAIRVKQAGGMVLVQDPKTAVHDGMPRAVIAASAADHVLPLGILAQELAASASPGYERLTAASSWSKDVSEALDAVLELIRTKAGFNLAGYKTAPLLRRIRHRMELRRVPVFREYRALLDSEPAELDSLVRGIAMHVTEFFRDPVAWAVLEHEVIPKLFEAAGRAPLRVWTPACASGEEAYSVAMLLAEHASTLAQPRDFQVFATDASAGIVARASRGSFELAAVSALSAERRSRFFHAVDGALHVRRSLREKMVFAAQDLLVDPPLPAVDLVTCRNLLIYLDQRAAKRVVAILRSSLLTGGHLFLGKGESRPSRPGSGFAELAPDVHIYRKSASSPSRVVQLPVLPFLDGGRAWSERRDRERLASSREELAASRAELCAVNEELRASNDQLNRANAELDHANGRLCDSVEELRTQSDILSSGAVAALFLDEELRVRWFTPGVRDLFPLTPGDVGRRISDLAQRFHAPSFLDDVRTVMLTGNSSEGDVRTVDERWYLKRIRPLRTGPGRRPQVGAAVTFTDITDRKGADAALRESSDHAGKILELMPAGVYTCDAEGRITLFNRRAAELWGREPALGDEQQKFSGSFRMWTAGGELLPHERSPTADAVRLGRPARNVELVVEQPSGRRLVVSLSIDVLFDRTGKLSDAVNVFDDVTEIRRAAEALRESEARYRSLYDALAQTAPSR